ncbi:MULTISPECIES: ATP-binding protein [Staphylococcus]|uniref:ATP-binding protein n=1 Tax=Staphylococcus TaxID=1279 RepID=UPI0009472598|nr:MULTISPECIES: ATP-binding protein [Staphylococcus]OLF31675.1 DNA replication protein DnaC [Staphylococcus sp. 47.1]PIS60882.1 DNA replication protein DnaC [Corynebacterium striatum]
MKSIDEMDMKSKLKYSIEEQENDLRCERCGNLYDYVKFSNGSEVRIGCDCEMIELAKNNTSRYKDKIKRGKIDSIFNRSMANEDLKNATFDNYIPPNENLTRSKEIIQRYVSKFSMEKENKRSLLLQGSFGIGKSHLAMSALYELKAQGYTVLFADVAQLVSTYRDTYNKNSEMTEKELDRIIKSVDFLVLDDYGTSLTNYGKSKMFDVLNLRTGQNNIFTTNNTEQELAGDKDLSKIFSRMMKNTTTIKMSGEDYRLKR